MSAVDCGTTQCRSLIQPLKRPTVLAVARAAVPAVVWVVCRAGVVGANDHVTKAGTRDGFAVGSKQLPPRALPAHGGGEPKSQAHQCITLADPSAIRHAEGTRRPF